MRAPGTPTILIISSDFDTREICGIFFRHHGYRVEKAAASHQGVAFARRNPPDVIITDLWVSTDEGWQVLDELKRNPETSGIPVLAFTAHALSTDVSRAEQAGVAGFIRKPADIRDLLKAVELLLQEDGQDTGGGAAAGGQVLQ